MKYVCYGCYEKVTKKNPKTTKNKMYQQGKVQGGDIKCSSCGINYGLFFRNGERNKD